MVFSFGRTNIWLRIGNFFRDWLIKSYEKDLMEAYKILGFKVLVADKHWLVKSSNNETIRIGSEESFEVLKKLLGT